MKVSILMNCYNSDRYLKEAIDSVFAQTYENWEIIFWDNNSNDKSAEILLSYKDNRVKYYRGDVTVPLYEARNMALGMISGDVIGFLDCDDRWMETKLEEQVPLFANENVGIVFSDALIFNNKGVVKSYFSDKRFYRGRAFKRLLDEYFLLLPTVLVRRKASDQLSYKFDGRFDMVGDADFFRRIGYSWELEMVDKTLAMWRIHPQSLSWTAPEKFSKETDLLLKKYQEIFPNFNIEYEDQIKVLQRDVSVGMAKIELSEGNVIEARARLKQHLWCNKSKVLYLFTYLPVQFYRFAYRRYLSHLGLS